MANSFHDRQVARLEPGKRQEHVGRGKHLVSWFVVIADPHRHVARVTFGGRRKSPNCDRLGMDNNHRCAVIDEIRQHIENDICHLGCVSWLTQAIIGASVSGARLIRRSNAFLQNCFSDRSPLV